MYSESQIGQDPTTSKSHGERQPFTVLPQFRSSPNIKNEDPANAILRKARRPAFRGCLNEFMIPYSPPEQKNKTQVQSRKSPSKPQTPSKFQVRFTQPISTNETSIDDDPSYSRVKRRKKEPEPQEKPTKLTVGKPVRSEISMDAWILILEKSSPSFLLNTAWNICQAFRETLKTSNIWRTSRINHFGENMPDCPPELTEHQYVDLLVGRGCHVPTCPRRDTRKVYWPFLMRLCAPCLSEVTVTSETLSGPEDQLSPVLASLDFEEAADIGSNIGDLLPAGSQESGRYTGCRRLAERPNRWQRISQNALIFRKDLEQARLEFQEVKNDSEADTAAWVKAKFAKTLERMKVVTPIQEWDVERRSYSDLRERKTDFYEERAAACDPPISRAILMKMDAFRKALETSAEPTERTWKTLYSKIKSEELRTQANQLIQWTVGRPWGATSPENAIADKLRDHRRSYPGKKLSEEQQFVIKIAQREFEKLKDQVHDEDLVLLCLRNIRRTYEKVDFKPIGLNRDGQRGIYELTLDDARMIIDNVIDPAINGRTTRGKVVLDSFRCIGCRRSDSTRTWSFKDLLDHIRRTHANYVGEGLYYYLLAEPSKNCYSFSRDVAYYQLPWFANMPMLPRHRKPNADTVWNPYEEEEYIEHSESSTKSAFENRKPRLIHHLDPSDFGANFLYAATMLRNTQISATAMTKIALRFAIDRQEEISSQRDEVCMNQVVKADLDSMQQVIADAMKVNPKLDFKFKCGSCMKDETSSKHTQHVRSTVPFAALKRHWLAKHELPENAWVQDMMYLPSDGELLGEILRSDEKLREEQEKRKKREEELTQKPSKRADPKATAFLSLPMAMDAFNELFDVNNEKHG